jgi:hypothetical protein
MNSLRKAMASGGQSGQWSPPESLAAKWERSLRKRVRRPVKVGAADLELAGGLSDVDQPLIELLEDLLEKQVGEAFCDLLF